MFAAVRSNILVLVGGMVECFPSRFEEENVITSLNICLDTLDEQLKQKGKGPSFVLVAGAIKCLDGLLMWFDRTVPAGGRSWKYPSQCFYQFRKFNLTCLNCFLL